MNEIYEPYYKEVKADESRRCATCDLFALQPGKRRTGVCFNRWMSDAKFDGDAMGGEVIFGAYGRVFPWGFCAGWIERGRIDRTEAVRI